ncbi:hypothetical protein [Coralliovum pocilloporae]|uniref:hypothetical protein n=1 Tax=Coralliovum pocilloporae TaxID=3066369 RepID=UPI0033079A18
MTRAGLSSSRWYIALGFLAFFLSGAAAAEQEVTKERLSLTLLSSTQQELVCRITLQFKNELNVEIKNLAAEIVLLDKAGLARDFLVLDGGSLTKDKRRIRQFDFQETRCADLSEILINDVIRCEGEGLNPRLCAARLSLTSSADIKLGL